MWLLIFSAFTPKKFESSVETVLFYTHQVDYHHAVVETVDEQYQPSSLLLSAGTGVSTSSRAQLTEATRNQSVCGDRQCPLLPRGPSSAMMEVS